MHLRHYSDKPITKIRNRSEGLVPAWKPHGFWVSVVGPDDWKWWTTDADFPRGSIVYDVRLRSQNNVLVLNSEHSVIEFGDSYSTIPMWSVRKSRDYIDWPKVAQKYSGIIIAPYQWNLRHDNRTFWYNTWDCASGCIWDASAIQSISVVEDDKEEAA